MNGGLASRTAVPETTSRARAPARAPVRAVPAVEAAPAAMPGRTRERLEAAIGPAPTTRERIVNRARAAAEPETSRGPAEAAVPSIVVNLAARRRPTPLEPEPVAPYAPLAPVIALSPARGPPGGTERPVLAQRFAPMESAGGVRTGPGREDTDGDVAPADVEPAGGEAAAPGPGAAGMRAPGAASASSEGATARKREDAREMGAPAPAPLAREVDGAAADDRARGTGAATPSGDATEPASGTAVGGETLPAVAADEAAAAGVGAAPVAALGLEIAAPERPSIDPDADPGFRAMKHRVQRNARRTKTHQPGAIGAATAQGASRPDPQREVDSKAADAHSGTMAVQEPGPFDREKFKADIKLKVEQMTPPATLEEADEFKESRKAEAAAPAIHGLVTDGRASAEAGIKTATVAPPDASPFKPKVPGDMVNDSVGPPLPAVGTAAAMPEPIPQWAIDLGLGPKLLEQRMREANITDRQLVDANEPQFAASLQARDEVRVHAEQDPLAYRAHEDAVLSSGRTEAETVAAGGLDAMHGARATTLAGVLRKKNDTKTDDQTLHDQIRGSILEIHDQTRDDVQKLLEGLDSTVDTLFTNGEKDARTAFEAYVAQKMREYKDDRYGGPFGWTLWLKDKALDLPSEVNRFYEDGRANYLKAMDELIDTIATVVGVTLGLAQLRVAIGRTQVRDLVEGLPKSATQLGAEVAADLDRRFDVLSSEVDAKRDEIVDTVAKRYVEARGELDTRIKQLQEENKGLLSKALDAITAVIKTVYELTQLLLRVLLKAAAAISDIVAHPIRFLGNLVSAVKGGLDRFLERIGDHLQAALLDLLFGELGKAGIAMPKALDFAGILDLALQVLGLTYRDVRERLVKRFGEPTVARMEQTVDIFKTLVRDGVAGLWESIREKISDLYDLVVGKIKTYVIERVVKAGIGYIAALLNPAAAFIKACQGIFSIVTFIVDRAKTLTAFVDSILDSITAIARGNVGGASEKIERALAGGLTLAIGFLARLANLGALSDQVQLIIEAVRRPIRRAVDTVIFTAAEAVAPAIALMRGKQERKRPEPPAPAPTDAPVAAAPASLEIDELFTDDGVEHHVFDEADGDLLVSSRPTPITEIDDDTGRLRRLHRQYLRTRRAYERALRQQVDEPGTPTGWTALRDEIREIVRAIVRRLEELQLDAPGASAPGIGSIRRHGQQTTRIRIGPPEWHMTSEHVMPFALGKRLWDAVGESVPLRGEPADTLQTTILIYRGAADQKTRLNDDALIDAFRTGYEERLKPSMRVLQVRGAAEGHFGHETEAEREYRELYRRLRDGMRQGSEAAVGATQDAVADEHKINGAARDEPKPVPGPGKIERAAEIQRGEVEFIADELLDAGWRR